ncbi:hypothetical protein PMAYCL1PPCAC_05278, partial [Pristionchus mayeri]
STFLFKTSPFPLLFFSNFHSKVSFFVEFLTICIKLRGYCRRIMPEYKLHYFGIRGLGEVPRQIFALAEVKFENVAVTREDWPEFKKKTPFGQMPVLEVDGKFIPQSFAIARFIASQHGLAGKTPFEAAWVDALADQWKDFQNDFKKFWYLKLGFGEGDVDAAKVEHGIPARDKFFPLVVKQLKKNGSGFLVGDAVTWVDVLVANAVADLEEKEAGFLAEYPEVVAHQKKVHAIPALKKWLETRPY